MNKNVLIKNKKNIIFFMIIMLVLQMIQVFALGEKTFADDATQNDFPFITNISLVDENGNSYDLSTKEFEKDANIRIKYKFEIPSDKTIANGEQFKITIPKEFKVNQVTTSSAVTISPAVTTSPAVGTTTSPAAVTTGSAVDMLNNNDLILTFNEQAGGTSGEFYVDATFNPDEIGTVTTKNIVFTENNQNFELPVKFVDDEQIKFQFITGVYLSDKVFDNELALNGENFGSNYTSYLQNHLNTVEFAKNSQMFIGYTFKIPQDQGITQGQKFTMDIPNEFAKILNNTAGIDLKTNEGDKIGIVTYSTDNKVAIQFSDEALGNNTEILGNFWFSRNLDASKIGDANPVPITFNAPYYGSKTFNFNFKQIIIPEIEPTITKTGTYSIQDQAINWKIVVDAGNLDRTNVSITDTLDTSKHKFKSGSLKVDGVAVDDSYFSNDKLVYNLSNLSSGGKKTIEFQTEPNSDILNSQGVTTNIDNTATLKMDGKSDKSSTTTVQIKNDFLYKEGTYNSSTKSIDWTIKVNSSNVNFVNPVITDVIPENLTLNTSTVSVDGTSVVDSEGNIDSNFTYDESNKTFKYNLPSDNNQHIIKFSTNIDSSILQSTFNTTVKFKNSVTLNVDLNGISKTYSYSSKDVGVGITNDVITKTAVKYDKLTKEITWKITVDNVGITIDNAKVTEFIDSNQEYVPNSLVCSDVPDIAIQEVTPDPTKYPKQYEISLGTVTGSTTITLRTKVTNDKIKYANKTSYINNACKLTGDNIAAYNANASQAVDSTLIQKSGKYDYTNRQITWSITVNASQTPIQNVNIIDKINDGQKYVDGSFLVKRTTGNLDTLSNTINNSFSYTPVSDDDLGKGGTLNYNFGTIKDKYLITFKTQIAYDSEFTDSNNDITVGNEAEFTTSETSQKISSPYNVTITNYMVKKDYQYTSGNDFITWKVNINKNNAQLDNMKITDTIPDGLQIDMDSVKLYEVQFKPDGTVNSANTAVSSSDYTTSYDFASRNFELDYSKSTNKAYLLQFDTLAKNSGSSFSNNVKFEANVKAYTSTKQSSNVQFSEDIYGGGASLSTGTIKIKKVDKDSTNTILSGAQFALIRDGKILQISEPTKSDGIAIFKRLKFGTEYSIKEIEAPYGYKLNDEVYKFTIVSGQYNHNVKEYNFENQKLKKNIEFLKKDSSGKLLEGAEFKLYLKSDLNFQNPIETATSDENGIVSFSSVSQGQYIIKESKAPEGYILSTNKIEVTVDASGTDGDTVNAAASGFTNESIKKTIQFSKVSEENLPLAGATFALYNEEDTNFNNSLKTAISNETGVVSFENVSYGNYVIKEVNAPKGYKLSDTIIHVKDSDFNVEGPIKTNPDTITNEQVKKTIQFLKKDPSGKPLSGAEFKLYQESDLNFQNPIETATSDENGIVSFSSVSQGQYIIKESKAPEGYILSTNKIEVTVDASGTDGDTVNAAASGFTNESIKKTIQFSKVSEKNLPLAGATFALYNEEDTNFNNSLKTAISNETGVVSFENISYGNYVIKEVNAPQGYKLSDTIIHVKDSDFTVEGPIKTNPDTITDEQVKKTIEFLKKDPSGKPLTGAEFKLYQESDLNFQNPIETATSDDNGMVIFSNVLQGQYIIKESKSPKGYVLSTDTIAATIDDNESDGGIVNIAPNGVVNQFVRKTIQLSKVSEDNLPLAGASFALYKKDDANFNNPLEVAVSNDSGIVSFENVSYGNYVIKEVNAPQGYDLSNVLINVSEDDFIKDKNPQILLEKVTNSKTKVYKIIEFYKKSLDGIPLSGAIFALYGEDDNAFENVLTQAVSDSNGLVQFNNILQGNYKIKEIKAPEGYKLSDTIIHVKDSDFTVDGSIKTNPYTITDEQVKKTIEFLKKDPSGKPLTGAEFKLYQESDLNFQNPIETATSDDNGMVIFSNVLQGQYIIKESKSPKGYVLSTDTIAATIDDNESDGGIVNIAPNGVVNQFVRKTIQLSKVSEDNLPLAGASFALYKKDDANFNNPLEVAVSNDSGIVSFENVSYGNYVIKEVNAPQGYDLSNVLINVSEDDFIKDKNPQILLEKVTNSKTKVYKIIEFYKKSLDGIPLSGAIFALYGEDDNAFENVLTQAVSDSNGLVQFNNILQGNYKIKEIKSPQGYKLSDTIIHVKDSDFTVEGSIKTNPDTITNEQVKKTIEFLKKDPSGKPLTGAEFKLYQESDLNFQNPIETATSDDNGMVIFSNVLQGQYIIKESKSPKGYVLSTDTITATIDDNESDGGIVNIAPNGVVNQFVKKTIQLSKVSEDNLPLAGASFALYKKEDANFNNPLKVEVSNDSGIVSFENVSYGNYVIKEVNAPQGYDLSNVLINVSEDDFIKDENPQILLEKVTNSKTKVYKIIEFYKKSLDGIPLSGAIFALYGEDDNAFGNVLIQAVSDSNGLVQFNNILQGNYKIKEIKAPEGYKLSDTIIHVKDSDFTVDGSIKTNPYTITNEQVKKTIEFLKKDPSGKPLTGAEFKLYQESDLNFQNPIETATSDDNGMVIFSNVLQGQYIIKESKSPKGYVLSTNTIAATIDDNESDGGIVNIAPNGVVNQFVKKTIQLSKVSEDNLPLAGASFALYKKEDANFNNPLKVEVSNDSGIVSFENVSYGNYAIKEVNAPQGYDLSNVLINVSEDDFIKDENPQILLEKVTNSKTKVYKIIEFYKKSLDGIPLSGAIFALYGEDDNAFGNVLIQAVSDSNGLVQFNNILQGNYKIKEIKSPEGYKLSDTIIHVKDSDFTVDGSIKTNPDTITNEQVKKTIEFLKKDPSGKPLTGAEFKLYQESDLNFQNPIETATSDDNGMVIFSNVLQGQYIIKESKSPKGYVLSTNTIAATIDDNESDGGIVNIAPNGVVNQFVKKTIQLSKVSEDNLPLAGASFALYKKDDANFNNPLEVVVSNDSGIVSFENVSYGNYAIKEVNAPHGYDLSNVLINVSEDDFIKDENPQILLGAVTNSKKEAVSKIIEFYKKSLDGIPLSGAIFALYGEDDTAFENILAQAVSASNGLVQFNNILQGNYKIKEIKSPEGYKLSDTIIHVKDSDFTVDGSIKTNPYTITDEVMTSTGTVIDKNGSKIQGIETKVTTEDDGTKTVSLKTEDAIVFKQLDGTKSSLSDFSKLSFSSEGNSNVIISDGNIKIKNLENGTEKKFDITYDLGNGQKIIIGTVDVTVSSDGNVSLVSQLIDPYGIVTDSTTGTVIPGVNITLYYADTDRNKASGKTPNTLVKLPEIAGFKPNNNSNPQVSDASGAYAFMVFPTSDYYIVATKDGYNKYISPTIAVEYDIVKFDIQITKLDVNSHSSGTSSSSSNKNEENIDKTNTQKNNNINQNANNIPQNKNELNDKSVQNNLDDVNGLNDFESKQYESYENNNQNKVLPQAGRFIDFTVLMSFGIFLILLGIAYKFRKKFLIK